MTLDTDLVELLQSDELNMSSRVNDALWRDVEASRHHKAVGAFLAELDAQDGPPSARMRAKYNDLFDRLA